MNQRLQAIGVALALLTPVVDAWAWGATGHEWISGIAIEKLPDSVPAFVRTPEAAAEIAVMGRELGPIQGCWQDARRRARSLAITSTWQTMAPSWACCHWRSSR